MSLGLREDRRRRSRRIRWMLIRWAFGLCLIVAAGYVAYETGARLAATQVSTLKERIEGLTATVDRLQRENAEREAAVDAQRFQAEEWQRRYERDVPRGSYKELFDLTKAKLEAGVDEQRLRFVIDAVENERACDGTPVTKRFVVRTPLYRGSEDSIRFADGTLIVTAKGPSARTEDGRPQAWFDPASEITLYLRHIGGDVAEVTGRLPVQHSMVVQDQEYRVSAVPGAKGFVEVTSDSCRFP